MKCKKAEKFLAAYVDSELKWWRNRSIRKHLEKCIPCKKIVEIQRQIKELIRTRAKHFKAPDALRIRIQKMLNK